MLLEHRVGKAEDTLAKRHTIPTQPEPLVAPHYFHYIYIIITIYKQGHEEETQGGRGKWQRRE